jgi:hypothetical protein
VRHALAFVTVLALLVAVACAEVKPVARTAVDVARDFCAITVAERNGISVEDAVKQFCATEEQLDPWIDELLAAKQRVAAQTQGVAP